MNWRIVAFKGALEVASLIENYDITLYKSENFDILKYCYQNYAHNDHVKEFIERMTIALEENSDMHESIDNYDSNDLIEISLDKHDSCYSYGHNANINYAYGDEFAIVPYVNGSALYRLEVCVCGGGRGWTGEFYKFVTKEFLGEEIPKQRHTSSGISTQV